METAGTCGSACWLNTARGERAAVRGELRCGGAERAAAEAGRSQAVASPFVVTVSWIASRAGVKALTAESVDS